jgi:hypothetical protein
MSFVDGGTCGGKNTAVSVRGSTPCLVDVPEYAIGCGDNATTGTITPCLRMAGTAANAAAQLPGCIDVTADYAGLNRLPEYLCGCGEAATSTTGRGDAASPIPCLPFVADTVCGKLPITSSAQLASALPNVLCGCGDGSNRTDLACIDNVPGSICGPQQICIKGQVGAAAGCNNGGAPVCVDAQGGEGAGPAGQGGAGDGLGDHCIPVPPN